MRYLLNVPANLNGKTRSLAAQSKKALNQITDKRESMKAWGQQCSPNCGCTVRFETELDGKKQISSASYSAKMFITTKQKTEHGLEYLQPVLTDQGENSKRRPIVKDCTCKTVHVLSEHIVKILPSLSLSQAQNQLEFTGVRSSDAFRDQVLKKHKLLNKNSERGKKCFDLVEEALTACLKGYMPRPRKSTVESISGISREESGISDLDPLRFVQAAKKRMGLFYRHPNSNSHDSASSMIPFHFINPDYDEPSSGTLTQIKQDIKSLEEENHLKDMDWVSHVDEKYQFDVHDEAESNF